MREIETDGHCMASSPSRHMTRNNAARRYRGDARQKPMPRNSVVAIGRRRRSRRPFRRDFTPYACRIIAVGGRKRMMTCDAEPFRAFHAGRNITEIKYASHIYQQLTGPRSSDIDSSRASSSTPLILS